MLKERKKDQKRKKKGLDNVRIVRDFRFTSLTRKLASVLLPNVSVHYQHHATSLVGFRLQVRLFAFARSHQHALTWLMPEPKMHSNEGNLVPSSEGLWAIVSSYLAAACQCDGCRLRD